MNRQVFLTGVLFSIPVAVASAVATYKFIKFITTH